MGYEVVEMHPKVGVTPVIFKLEWMLYVASAGEFGSPLY